MNQHSISSLGGVTFHRPFAFWLGVGAVTIGVIGHLPMYVMARDNGFILAGMPMDLPMKIGMAAIVAGLIISLYGLYPRSNSFFEGTNSSIRVDTLDDTPLSWTHIGLVLAMATAVMIDIMKPTALAFVMPGMTAEYGLQSPLNPGGTYPVAWVALAGISGTVFGSFLWGWLGDKIGRRASILYAGIGFIATSICGAMPDFFWNLAMCFLMGLAVGGMLPLCYAMLAETMPARHRGWLMILIGADIAGAYILTSWIAAELVPIYSWRILWLIGLPTGLVFIFLNRWIPESPRFLLVNGRQEEARRVMERYGSVIVEERRTNTDFGAAVNDPWRQFVSPPLIGLTLVVACLAVGSGLVLFGFNLWIPTNLRKLGFSDADAMLRNAALIGFPLTFLVAWLYGFWSSKKTIIILAGLTAVALAGFAVLGDAVVRNRTLLNAMLIIPIWGISSVVAVLSVYTSEIFPTRIRAMGSGFAAGASKAGGVFIIAAACFGIAAPSISTVALIGAVPMALSVILVIIFGVETCQRPLDEISRFRTKDPN